MEQYGLEERCGLLREMFVLVVVFHHFQLGSEALLNLHGLLLF